MNVKRSYEKWLAWKQRARPLLSRKGLEPGKPPKRRTRMPKTNQRRRRDRFRRAYHSPEFVAWLCGCHGCAIRGCADVRIVPAHVRKTRGAGGTWQDTAPLCASHETAFHQLGAETFRRTHGLDYDAICDAVVMGWKVYTGAER